MFVSFRKCSRPQKPDPISDHNCQNLCPFSDQNGSKTIPFGAAHTYMPYIGEYPPGEKVYVPDEDSLEQRMNIFHGQLYSLYRDNPKFRLPFSSFSIKSRSDS